MELERTSSTAAAVRPEPDALAKFLVKDLDTGMQSFVNDVAWIEQPDAPDALRAPPKPRPSSSSSSSRQELQSSAQSSSNMPDEEATASRSPRRSSASSFQKRAQSDELVQKQSASLRSADHVRVTAYKKREREFGNLYKWQRVPHAHIGAIRVVKFSRNGKYLATAGMDAFIKIWDVDAKVEDACGVPHMGSAEGDAVQHYQREYLRKGAALVTLKGHTSDVTDMSWSKNEFLLSASMDKTLRLWHPKASDGVCLRKFTHTDFVTTVAFHPSDEQICVSGTSDGTLRLLHLKQEKCLSEAELDDLITACAITTDGTTVLAGTFHGRCKFYGLFDEIQGEWQFKHTTQLDVRSRKAKNSRGKKICGFTFRPRSQDVLVSSNDSRLRLYRMDDKSVLSKFMGHHNTECQLGGSFSPCGRYVLTGSENRTVCIWEVENTTGLLPKRRSANPYSANGNGTRQEAPRKDRNFSIESFAPHDNAHVTAAVFAPRKASKNSTMPRSALSNRRTSGLVIVTASEDGELRVFGCA